MSACVGVSAVEAKERLTGVDAEEIRPASGHACDERGGEYLDSSAERHPAPVAVEQGRIPTNVSLHPALAQSIECRLEPRRRFQPSDHHLSLRRADRPGERLGSAEGRRSTRTTIEVKQVFYNSKDGTRVPMFIAHKKGAELDGEPDACSTATAASTSR